MRNKMFVLVLTLMMVSSTIMIISNDFKVEADPGGDGGGDDGSIGLDYDYMWEVTWALCNITHSYPPDMIPKGRAWATLGEDYTIKELEKRMENISLEDVHKEKLGPIASKPLWFYTSKVETIDFELTINNASNIRYC